MAESVKKILRLIVAGKKSAASFWIMGAAGLIFLGCSSLYGGIHWAKLEKYVPSVSQMVTSPVAQELIQKKESERIEAEPAAEPKNNNSQSKAESSDKAIIVIPRIGAAVPLVTAKTTDTSQLHLLLDEGAVIYPGSAGFGNIGQTVLMGHSAPVNWPNIKHDTAFSRINELISGDKVSISYQGRTYEYSVTRSEVIEKGGDLAGGPTSGSSLVLVSCWPPGRDQKRLAVEALLVPR
jgi:LPXTG-site transpeptidase (sortase) family protein